MPAATILRTGSFTIKRDSQILWGFRVILSNYPDIPHRLAKVTDTVGIEPITSRLGIQILRIRQLLFWSGTGFQ